MRFARHILFWICYALYFYVQSIAPRSLEEFTAVSTYTNALISLCCFFPVCVLSVYTSINFILRLFIERKRYGRALIAFVLLFSLGTSINYFAAGIYFAESTIKTSDQKGALSLGYLNTIWAMIISGLAMGLRIGRKWYLQQKEIEEISKQKSRNELILRKNSMHPAFLYSSLGSIYDSLNRNSESSSSMILVLSNMLSYSLYESKTEYISLRAELNAVSDFIKLETLKNAGSYSLSIDDEIQQDELLIPPMSILSRLQNDFEQQPRSAQNSILIGETEDNLEVKITCAHPRTSKVFRIPKTYAEAYEPA